MRWTPPSRGYVYPQFIPPNRSSPATVISPAAPYASGPTIDVTPTNVEVHQPSAPPLPTTTRTYSRIILADFARHKFFSTTPAGEPPDVTQTRGWWDRFHGPDDHTVRLFLALTREARAHLDEHGYNDDPLGEEPLIDDTIMQEIREAQEAELASATDPTIEAGLRQEHAEQLDAAKNEKIQITPDHLLRYPFERTFEKRIDATRYKAMVERVYIQKPKKMLSEQSD